MPGPYTQAPYSSSKLEKLLLRFPVVLQLARFVAIGVLNTALDFIVLNFLSKTFDISTGTSLGVVNVFGFALAMVQSFMWNRYWAFNGVDGAGTNVAKVFMRLVTVGVVGFAAFASVLISAQLEALPIVYLAILGAFILVEVIVWISFGLRLGVSHTQSQGKEFILFILVSFVGLIINSAVVWLVSQYIVDKGLLSTSPDLIKNVAKIFATGLSLVWNFLGYKIFVFKK